MVAGAPPTTPSQAGETKPRSSREDVLQFLDSLDSYSSPPPSASRTSATPIDGRSGAVTPAAGGAAASSTVPTMANAEDAQSVLDFLDEITQRSSTPTASVKSDPSVLAKKASLPSGLNRSTSRPNIVGAAVTRKSGESVRGRTGTPASAAPDSASLGTTVDASVAQGQAGAPAAGGGWGWSSVWSQASSIAQQASQVVQQARTVAEEQVKSASTNAAGVGGGLIKALGENEQAKKWSEGVVNYAKGAHLDQIGKDLKSTTLKSLTDLLNAVAPPIAEHEVLQVSLSHDMLGYDGVETLVYNGLAKVMEQIEGGTLVVNKGDEEKAREPPSDDPDDRELNAVEGLEEGWKLASANLDELIKKSFKPKSETETPHQRTSSITVPVTTCPIYIRIQPVLAPLPGRPTTSASDRQSLFFLFLLRDPTHSIAHETLSQSLPAQWLDIPFEHNEWVEDFMVDIIRKGIEILGKEYIDVRMHAQSNAINQAREAAQQALSSHATSAGEGVKVADEPVGEEATAVAAASSRAV